MDETRDVIRLLLDGPDAFTIRGLQAVMHQKGIGLRPSTEWISSFDLFSYQNIRAHILYYRLISIPLHTYSHLVVALTSPKRTNHRVKGTSIQESDGALMGGIPQWKRERVA